METAEEIRSEKSVSAPYVPYMSMKNFIGTLAENGLPSHVDRSVMGHLAGGTQNQLSSALKFLELVNDDLTPTNSLSQLVAAHGSESWSEVLAAVIKTSYSEIVADIDLEVATPHRLDQCFSGESTSNLMLDKIVRFFLAALEDAKIPVSNHLKKRKPKATRKSRANGKSKSQAVEASVSASPAPVAKTPDMADSIEYPIHFSRGRSGLIRVPADITEEDCKMINLVIPLLEGLAKGN